MNSKLQGAASALGVLVFPLVSTMTGFLSLLIPGAGAGIFIGSAYFGAFAVAAGVSGPAGWGLFGLFTLWGA